MGRIHLLPELIQNQIAAGEVVERPASVIKELIENSLDAQATSLRISIEEGGLRSMQIQDNGIGMDMTDLEMCTVRYATSKLHTTEDLFTINHYGFRGEALASVAAIAKVTIKTKQASTDTGYQIQVEGGVSSPIEPVGLSDGTIVRIEDLFFNTPARKKYLKSPSTEFGHISSLLTQYALLHYDKEWLFVHNGRTVLHMHPTSTWEERMRHILHPHGNHLLEVFLDRTELHVQGWCSPPNTPLTSRKHTYFYVNGRPVRSALLQRACTEAYHRLLSSSEFPILILSLTIDPALVDVNVHPRKTEVRFLQEQDVFRTIVQVLRNRLEKQEQYIPNNFPHHTVAKDSTNIPQLAKATTTHSFGFGTRASSPYTLRKTPISTEQRSVFPSGLTLSPSSEEVTASSSKDFEVIQQLERCYILLHTSDGFAIIDQHAAHERILFERFRKKVESDEITTQSLAIPEVLQLSLSERALINEHQEAFEQIGFHIQDLGGDTLGLTRVPTLLGDQHIGNAFQQIMEDMITHVPLETSLHRTQDKVLAYTACKSAVKFGDSLTHQEMESLVQDYFATPLRATCPHGRPSMRHFSMNELAGFFKRPI